ncbi:MAG TPA: hypothetical protein VFA28_01940 [Bryobacteraceae bacterium]|jgi:hypothetical protein|nr:hypothetical protein [Bryobacteraceae bacterium]
MIRVRYRRTLGAVDPSFCRAIVDGQILQSQVDIATLAECSAMGITGVQASPISVVTAAAAGALPNYTYQQSTAAPPASLPAPVATTLYMTPTQPPAKPTVQAWNPPPAQTPAPPPAQDQPSSTQASTQTQPISPTPSAPDPNAGDVVLGTDAEHAFHLTDISGQAVAKAQDLWKRAQQIAPWYVWAAGAAIAVYLITERRKRKRT